MFLSGCEVGYAGRKYTLGFERWGTKPTPVFYGNSAPEGIGTTQFGGIHNVSDGRDRSLYSGNFICSNSERDQIISVAFTPTAPIYTRMWIKISGQPTSNFRMLALSNNVNDDWEVFWKSDGHFGFGRNGTISVSTANLVTTNGWILLKAYTNWSASNDTDYVIINALSGGGGTPETLRTTAAHTAAIAKSFYAGCFDTPSGGNATFLLDDVGVNDGTGSFENGWPEDTANVIYLPPISDNARGNWVTEAGGTTNLFQRVNGVPPTGTTGDGDQLKNTTSGTNDNYDMNCQAVNNYTDVSSRTIPSGNAIRLAFAFVREGQHTTASTATGAVALISNPVDAGEASFTFGDGTAHGTDASSAAVVHWVEAYGQVAYFPTINRSASGVVRSGRRQANTNQIEADQAGMMIEIGSYAGSGINAPVFEIGD